MSSKQFMFPGVENYLKSLLARDEVKCTKVLDSIELGLTQREIRILEDLKAKEYLPLDMTTHIIIDYVASYIHKAGPRAEFSLKLLDLKGFGISGTTNILACDFSFLSNEDPCHAYYQFTRRHNYHLVDKIKHLLPSEITALDFFDESYILIDDNNKKKEAKPEIGSLLAGYEEDDSEELYPSSKEKRLPFEFETPGAFGIDIPPNMTKITQEIATHLWQVGDIQQIKLAFKLEAEPGPTSFSFLSRRSDSNFYFKRILAQAELDLKSQKLRDNEGDLTKLSKEATEFCKGLEMCLMLKKENSRTVSLERSESYSSGTSPISPTSWLDSCTSSSESIRSRPPRRKRRRRRVGESRRRRRYHSCSRDRDSPSEDDQIYRKRRRFRSLSRNRDS